MSGEGPPHAKRAHRHEVDALLVEAPGAPSFELAEQAGARVAFDAARGGYVPVTDENGRALPWLADEAEEILTRPTPDPAAAATIDETCLALFERHADEVRGFVQDMLLSRMLEAVRLGTGFPFGPL